MNLANFIRGHAVACFLLLLGSAFLLSLVLPRFRVAGVEEIVTSWYGGAFHGRLTASGDRFNMLDFTAAHRTLPLGSWLRVTDLSSGRQVIVRVTDRGPYRTDRRGRVIRPLTPHPSRTLDLSYLAAHVLGIKETGVSRIRIERLTR
jgi:rare lipoprotein A